MPTKVKIGSKGKATVSTTGGRPRSKSLSIGDRVSKSTFAGSRRGSINGALPIRPRPDWMEQEKDYTKPASNAINCSDLNRLLDPDMSSASTPSTVIMLSSTSHGSAVDSPIPRAVEPIGSLYDFQTPMKQPWTPPPDEMQDAFIYRRDPLIPMEDDNTRSPMIN
jgi:hypothetical protein